MSNRIRLSLRDAPKRVCIIILARNAVRVFQFAHQPSHYPAVDSRVRKNASEGAFLAMRAILMSLTEATVVSGHTQINSIYASEDIDAFLASNSDYNVRQKTMLKACEEAASGSAYAGYVQSEALDRFLAQEFERDIEMEFDELVRSPLWHTIPPTGYQMAEIERVFTTFFPQIYWSFWKDLFKSIETGRSTNEPLLEIALIQQELWKEGPKRIAEAIDAIKRNRATKGNADDQRREAFEPKSLDRILSNKAIASFQSYNVALDVSLMFEAFHRDTGLNEVPETFLALQAVPKSLNSISAILIRDDVDPRSKQELLVEIGRLNAKVATLEAALEKALASKEKIVAPEFKRQLGKSLGDWKMYTTLAAGVWLISGDVEGMQARLENILAMRETLFGEDSPSASVIGASDPAIAMKK